MCAHAHIPEKQLNGAGPFLLKALHKPAASIAGVTASDCRTVETQGRSCNCVTPSLGLKLVSGKIYIKSLKHGYLVYSPLGHRELPKYLSIYLSPLLPHLSASLSVTYLISQAPGEVWQAIIRIVQKGN